MQPTLAVDHSLAAVSYTHLDVYKRQQYYNISNYIQCILYNHMDTVLFSCLVFCFRSAMNLTISICKYYKVFGKVQTNLLSMDRYLTDIVRRFSTFMQFENHVVPAWFMFAVSQMVSSVKNIVELKKIPHRIVTSQIWYTILLIVYNCYSTYSPLKSLLSVIPHCN